MNSKIGKGIKIPDKPVPRCGKTAKDIYEDCQKKVNKPNKPPVLPNLSETMDKCSNEQADHMLEICAGGGEEDCSNLQPLNESVNKSFGSQVGSIVRQNPGAMITKVQLHKTECTERPSVNC